MKKFFGNLWSGWKELTHYIGDFQARLILTFFYFTIALPFGLIGRFIVDPLKLREKKADSNWTKRETLDKDMATARNQF